MELALEVGTQPAIRKKIKLDDAKLSYQQRRVALLTLALPAVGAVAAVAWAVKYGVHLSSLVSAGVLYFITTVGLTVGYHRFFTHRSFKAGAAVRAVLAVTAMMAAQGPVLFWVASHRRHHAYSDEDGDCHSPLCDGKVPLSGLRGLWHAHFGWMLKGEITNVPMFAKDLLQDGVIVFLNRYYLSFVAAGLALPALVGWFAVGGWAGALEGLLWGGFARIFFVHQITWGLNSLNHVFGKPRYVCTDNSRNIGWLAVITLGEGWHNNHHAFPTSARFGHAWWELDVGYAVIAALELAGQCTDVKKPNFRSLAGKLVSRP